MSESSIAFGRIDSATDKLFEPLSPELWERELDHLKGGFAERLNVYRVMAHNPPLLRAWTALRQHLVVDNALGTELTEIAILRAAHHLNSRYERAHHIVRARACGIGDDDIRATLSGGPVVTARYEIIVQAVDELVRETRLSGATVEALDATHGKRGVLDLIAIVGFYTTLGFILNSFATPLDGDVISELASRPLKADAERA